MSQPALASPRARRKHRDLLDAALQVFLERGYAETSMDEVAALAGASKVTLYHHFTSKERLFEELIEEQIERAERQSEPLIEELRVTSDVETALRAFAREFLLTVMDPQLLAMRRLLIGAAGKFPRLADAWYRRGPERSYDTLSELFALLDRRGRLRVADPDVAARAFTWLVLSVPLNAAMFRVADTPTEEATLTAAADDAVDVFLAAYAVPAGPPTPR